MTVYELIQELTRCKSDSDVEITFTTKSLTVQCTECNAEIEVEGLEKTADGITINERGWRVYIECTE